MVNVRLQSYVIDNAKIRYSWGFNLFKKLK